MTQGITPERVGLLELLRGSQGTQFVIPAYQRNYTWSANNEVKQLLDDIKIVLQGERNKHFLGIMIYLETRISTFQLERSVIDGQQRLTTIFLILYAIKELMIENGMNEDANKLENMYLVNPFNDTNKFKLKPLVSDDTVYQQIVSRDFKNIVNRKSAVYQNFCYIKTVLKELLANSTIGDILEAMNKLYIVCVPIGQEDYPQKIFESINATGAKLTASDLIRNYILMPITSDIQDKYYEIYWKRLEELVDSDSKKLEAFFRFFIMAKNKALVNKSSVYRAFTDWYEANIGYYGEEGIFKGIVSYANYYSTIYKADISTLAPALHKPIEEFRFIDSDMPAPLLMEFYAIHKQSDENNTTISAEQIGDIITILNSYLMRRSLCGMDTSDISRYFPALLKEILAECNGDYTHIVEIFKKNLINRNKGNLREMPDDNKLSERIMNENMYSLRKWLFIFLRKLESENNPAPVDFSHLSIEHLMPQTATQDWYDALGVDKNTYEENLNRLGNLTLVAKRDNSKMGNNVWDYKNKILMSTNHLKINHELLQKEHWTIGDIESRTRYLIGEIARLYPYFEAKDAIIKKIPIRIDFSEGTANGYYYPDNGSVEILKDSALYMDFPNPEQYSKIEQLRRELLEDGIIQECNHQLVFTTNYHIYPKQSNSTALSTAAAIILHGSRNGWEYWMTEDGKPLNAIEDVNRTAE